MPITDKASLYVSYSLEVDESLPPNTFRFSQTAPSGDPRTFWAELYNAGDELVDGMNTIDATTTSSPISFERVPGKSLTARLNVADSNLHDVVIPFVFSEDVSVVLSGRKLSFVWSSRTVPVDGAGGQPLVKLDPKGSPIVLSYDVPEPTSYRGRHVIELDFPDDYFAEERQESTRAALPIPVYGDDTRPPMKDDIPPSRLPVGELTDERITDAFTIAQETGYFDPAVFPNVQAGGDSFSREYVRKLLGGLDAMTVVTQLKAGNRLTIYRASSGEPAYRFIPAPVRGAPALLLVEYYRLSSFPARYGAGRTIKTFSLLPGERTRIRINTYKRSSESTQRTSSIVDSSSDETEKEFESSVLAEQSSQDSTSKSFEYHAEAEAEARASWGWGSANVKASGGVKGSSNAAREEFAKNISNAVAHNAARASARRDVQIDTSLDVKLETGEEQAVERDLENINVSRTLNFVFRQMNQEFISVLHLVDVRIAFFNGYSESRFEVPLPELDRLLDTYIVSYRHDEVRQVIIDELDSLTDYRGQPADDFVQLRTLTGTANPAVNYLRVNPDYTTPYRVGVDGATINVPGVVISADSHVMRTDGIVVDTFLGLGNGLDDYSIGLQTQAVRSREIANDQLQAETDRLRLATQIVRDADTARAELFQQLFPRPQIVNQIEQAAINGQNTNGQMVNPALAD